MPKAGDETRTDNNGLGNVQAFTATETLLLWNEKHPESDPTQLFLI